MFTFVVCFLWTIFGSTISEYVPVEDYNLQNPYEVEYAHTYDNYEPKDYHFQYAVSDPHTGDHKSQWEVKEKGVVRGMYSLLEPDGTTRVVEYIADDHGFRATVKKLGTPIVPHEHHGEDVLVSLPEAYSNGYNGAYSGLGENYGIENYATPIESNGHHDLGLGDAINYGVPIESNNHHELGQGYGIPIESNNHHEVSHGYGIPIQSNNHHHELGLGGNYHVTNYGAPIQSSNHHDKSVEVHGFTGNADDDSSYTNFDDESEHKGAIYYPGDDSDSNRHNYYSAQPEIISAPYKLAYQYDKPYAYIGQSYDGY